MTDTPIRPPRLYSDGLLDLATRARVAPATLNIVDINLLGMAVRDLVADLDAERQRHQVTMNQLDAATTLVAEADRQLATMRARLRAAEPALAQANRDIIGGVARERAQDAVIAELRAKLRDAGVRDPTCPIDHLGACMHAPLRQAFESATVAITGRSYAEVSADLDAAADDAVTGSPRLSQ